MKIFFFHVKILLKICQKKMILKKNYYIEKENEIMLYEKQERNNKIIKDFNNFIQPHLNKAMNNKFKKDIIEKIENLNNFYENLNLIIKTENFELKNSYNSYFEIN